ncbi:Protein FEV [Taenia crassiceps]|uniref:Protein FEV n=1 Tax=Taenia crassiceps TaxID=6207 RepID=A0ABR4QIC7_9CEST
MNYKHPLSAYGSISHFAPEPNMDPVLTDAISGEESGYRIDATKQEEDEGIGLFDLQSQPPTWNVCLLQSSNTPIAGTIAPISASFSDSRHSRLSSSEFQDTEDLQTAFGGLNTSEDVVSSKPSFINPPDRVLHRLGDFDEENGFDSGFGSLQLTPSEIQSEGMCENTLSQSPQFWRRSTMEDFCRLSNEAPLANEEEEEEEESYLSDFGGHMASQQMLEHKRYHPMPEYAPKFGGECLNVFTDASDNAPISNDAQDRFYWNDIRSSSQDYRYLGKSSRNALLTQLPLPEHCPTISITTPVAVSSSSSFAFDANRFTTSPVSHRNLNKRVVQQEASEFLSCSEGGNLDDSFDDVDAFGIDADLEDTAFPLSSERPPPSQPSTRGALRNCQSFSLRYNQNSPTSGIIHRRSRSTVLSNSPIDRPRKTCAQRNGGRKRNLLNFILELLTTRQTCVEWVDKTKQVFQIVNPDQLTRLWGEHKNNIKMSFDSLSRSLRLYYKPGKLERIPGTRHQYRLIQRPPESPDLLRETSSYGCISEHRRSGTPVNHSTALKQHPSSQKPYL